MIAIDSQTLEVKSRWPVAPAGGPTALAIDQRHRRLFIAGRNPQMFAVMDADSGRVIQTFPISAGVDAAAYDRETGLAFASTREGMVHIFHEDSPDKFSVVETVKTEVGAKTMGLDLKKRTISSSTRPISNHRWRLLQAALRGHRRFPARFASWCTGGRKLAKAARGRREGTISMHQLLLSANFFPVARSQLFFASTFA